MSGAGRVDFDLRDERDGDVERDDEQLSGVEPWPNVGAISRLFFEYELAQGEAEDDPQIHLNFGRAALEQNGGLESYAIDALRKYVVARPDDAEGHYLLGAAHSCKGAHRDAAAAYERAAELRPDDADILMALHFAYFSLLRFEEAVGCIERVVKIVGRAKKDKLEPSLFLIWKGIDLLLAGEDEEVEQLLTPGTRFEGAIGQAAHFGLALLAVKRRNRNALAEHRGQLEKAESPLLFALRSAEKREAVEPREAVHALTGRPQQP